MHVVQRLHGAVRPASVSVGIVAAVCASLVGIAWGVATPPGLVVDAVVVQGPLPTAVAVVVAAGVYLLFAHDTPRRIVARGLYLVAAAAVAFPVTNGLLPFLWPAVGAALSRSVVGVVALGILFALSWTAAGVCAVVGYAIARTAA